MLVLISIPLYSIISVIQPVRLNSKPSQLFSLYFTTVGLKVLAGDKFHVFKYSFPPEPLHILKNVLYSTPSLFSLASIEKPIMSTINIQLYFILSHP